MSPVGQSQNASNVADVLYTTPQADIDSKKGVVWWHGAGSKNDTNHFDVTGLRPDMVAEITYFEKIY